MGNEGQHTFRGEPFKRFPDWAAACVKRFAEIRFDKPLTGNKSAAFNAVEDIIGDLVWRTGTLGFADW